MSTLSILLIFIVFAVYVAIYGFMVIKNKSRSQSSLAEENIELVYVEEGRVTMLAFVLGLLGSFLLMLAGLGMPEVEGFAIIPLLLFVFAGVYFFYLAITFYRKRSSVIQLKLTPTGVYHKPIKWYSHSKGGSLNALSVYFADDWYFTAYKELSYISLQESTWIGNSINLAPLCGKRIKLLLIIDDKALIKEIYLKIHEQIKKLSPDNFETHALR